MGAHTNMDGNDVRKMRVVSGLMIDPTVVTLAADITIDVNASPLQILAGGGSARNVTLPAATRGLSFFIYNSSGTATALTVKNAAAATIGTVAQGKGALFVSDGTNWYAAIAGA